MLVNDHILSYVMDVISFKSTDSLELEKLYLLVTKITEIDDLFKITETDYRKLINLLFENNKFLTEINECLAYNYPITTQECILPLTYENKSSKDSKSSSTPQKNEFVRVNGIFKKMSIIKEEVEVEGEGVIQVEAVKTREAVTLTENKEEEKVEVDSSNDEGEKLEVKSGKCTASSLKSKKCTESPSKKNKCTSSKLNKFPELPSKSNKCTVSPSKSDKCTASPSKSN